MSRTNEHDFQEPLQDQSAGSVYDFLYHDAKRIGAFLSQFETYGLPQTVKAVERATEQESTDALIEGTAKIPYIGSGKGGTKWTAGSLSESAAERTYDPLWRNALTFLDYLQSNDLLERSLDDAQIGRFVLVSGDLAVFDMGILEVAWDNPLVSNVISQAMTGSSDAPDAHGNRRERRAALRSNGGRQKSPEDGLKEGIIHFIKMLPHSVVSSLQHNGHNVWFNLSRDSMTVSSTELLLKHGVSIPGTWHVIGVFDAYPDDEPHPEFGDLSLLTSAATFGGFGAVIGGFVPVIRQVMGRPAGAYGVTPLMVFREVNG
ncbi:hypothetical protein [Asticcacaulis excentricus]|uniref:hypothetical protein n=1 Tax=Asticcacaulis excentricus TaxID=78587 RepID=UPI000F817416|nr:hypothetical protein [Asticcacaulis excentricus]